MKVAVIQHDIVWADRSANFELLRPLISTAAEQKSRLVVLSEMFSTGFVVDRDNIGEPVGGPSSQFLTEMASTHNIYIAGSCPEVEDDDSRPFNSLVLAAPSGIQHRYHKIHPFTYGGEHKQFRAGNHNVVVEIDDIRIALSVCYDLRFADEYWGLAPDTDVYVIPANWPASRREHWMALLRARAIENQAYVIGCNRVGEGGGLTYSGDSRIIDPLGNVLAEADHRPQILYANIDAATVKEIRTKFPFLQDRR